MERVTVSNWDNTVQQRPMPAKTGFLPEDASPKLRGNPRFPPEQSDSSAQFLHLHSPKLHLPNAPAPDPWPH